MKHRNYKIDNLLIKYNGVCQYCGYSIYDLNEARDMCVEHVFLKKDGGISTSNKETTTLACFKCNAIARDKLFSSFENKKRFIQKRTEIIKKGRKSHRLPDVPF